MDKLNKDILREVISYIIKPKYKMVDWIKPYFEKCLLENEEDIKKEHILEALSFRKN